MLGGQYSWVHSIAFSPDGTGIITPATYDDTAHIWDVNFATMSTNGLFAEVCARRLVAISKLSRDDMRLLGYPDDQPEIDVCEGAQ